MELLIPSRLARALGALGPADLQAKRYVLRHGELWITMRARDTNEVFYWRMDPLLQDEVTRKPFPDSE